VYHTTNGESMTALMCSTYEQSNLTVFQLLLYKIKSWDDFGTTHNCCLIEGFILYINNLLFFISVFHF